MVGLTDWMGARAPPRSALRFPAPGADLGLTLRPPGGHPRFRLERVHLRACAVRARRKLLRRRSVGALGAGMGVITRRERVVPAAAYQQRAAQEIDLRTAPRRYRAVGPPPRAQRP